MLVVEVVVVMVQLELVELVVEVLVHQMRQRVELREQLILVVAEVEPVVVQQVLVE
tara:strand:- start:24 stop:191 length:168 start_codon:yes stop_codon:yes gene_type:complete